MFKAVLIANRGAIACRIIRTLKKNSIKAIAVYHEEDADSLHVQQADIAISLGRGNAMETYLNVEKILQAASQSGAEAIHPGYGFLSENADFVERCEAAGFIFIGPTAEQITRFGLKHSARELAMQASVPLLPGSAILASLEQALGLAEAIGYPVMLKSSAGGGGIGMQVCRNDAQLRQAWDSVRRLGTNYFSDDSVFLEKFIERARHIEVQVFGDGQGRAVALGERDCSLQRRNQKVVEESPAPDLDASVRASLYETAERLMMSVAYRNAGTVEFIFDAADGSFYFLEVNTRLQVEHGVTEEVWGVDLVEWMLQLAARELEPLEQLHAGLRPVGHAIQVRVYAENVIENFRPSAGLLSSVHFPEAAGLRIDTWVESGLQVPALFDPMLAKIISHAGTRQAALQKLLEALSDTELYGIETNLGYLQSVLDADFFRQGKALTKSLHSFAYQAQAITVIQPGTMTTVQDYPGRKGYWDVGVPPSGPMDNVSFRLANRLLENPEAAAGLEITVSGPTLRFQCDSLIALSGAKCQAKLNGKALVMYRTYPVSPGDLLEIGKLEGAGSRAYLAVKGGIQCPEYLGSRATFSLGQFGGHNGRTLRSGDVLPILPALLAADFHPGRIRPEHQPQLQDEWELRVIYGPHGAPDFFTREDVETFFAHPWEVHYNSSRTGIRLLGPRPEWARSSGGEAGLHPSNIHDNAYAFGTVDFTGDMPVILGPDGPSLGGFVCPATVIQADLWKLGQLKAGARVRFVPVSLKDAIRAEQEQLLQIRRMKISETPVKTAELNSPVLAIDEFQGEVLQYRIAGDHFLLIEFGDITLDIERRFKVHALMLYLQDQQAQGTVEGIEELTPGIRSLQVHFDSQKISWMDIVDLVRQAETGLQDNEQLRFPGRTVYLPLSWDDEACRQAVDKYRQSVRQDAPWCPSNLEFIRRINGLDDIAAVKQIVFAASYLVMGLGDVYLGAPVATPLDPRHRLVTTKYNPARTWTAENSVGIGGAYLCIYGMEGPGGYQLLGRTLQMWNRYRSTACFSKPWLLRFFDQIRFYEVSHEELERIRAGFPLGRFTPRIEAGSFSLQEYRQFLLDNHSDIERFQQVREQAFDTEMLQWRKDSLLMGSESEPVERVSEEELVPENIISITSPVSGSVWQVCVDIGDVVSEAEDCFVLESMKMEISIPAGCSGRVNRILKTRGQAVSAGQPLLWIELEHE